MAGAATSDWIALETRLSPEPIRLARRLWAHDRPALLWSADGSGPSYVTCDPVEQSDQLDPEPQLSPRTLHPAGRWGQVPRWIGLLPYEAERGRLERPQWVPKESRPPPLLQQPQWLRYPAVAVVDRRVTLVGERAAVLRLQAAFRAEPEVPLECRLKAQATEAPGLHVARVQRALELIAEGEIYQVNLARRLGFEVEGSALSLLAKMAVGARPAFGAALELGQRRSLVSTSPELFLRTEYRSGRGLRAWTLPIKGTRPRGGDAPADQRLRVELERDEKEQAELAMVVDIERSDLGRVAKIGSVQAEAPYVVAHPSVFHRQALVSCALPDALSRSELLRAMLPSGSITGAPKIRAMEVIAELEADRRGAYTGALGYLSHDGQLQLAMAIRCLSVVDGVGHYHVGGGIVADSDPERELKETGWKAAQLKLLLDG